MNFVKNQGCKSNFFLLALKKLFLYTGICIQYSKSKDWFSPNQ